MTEWDIEKEIVVLIPPHSTRSITVKARYVGDASPLAGSFGTDNVTDSCFIQHAGYAPNVWMAEQNNGRAWVEEYD
jgi:hypothetical protein